MDTLRLRLLERELSFHLDYALSLLTDLEASDEPTREDAAVLTQATVAAALKISHLIWRFGRRVTDRFGQDEARELRTRFLLGDPSPLSPGAMERLSDLLLLAGDELRAAVDPDASTVTLNGVLLPLTPLFLELRRVGQIHRAKRGA